LHRLPSRPGSDAAAGERIEPAAGERLVEREPHAFVEVSKAVDRDGQVETMTPLAEVDDRIADHSHADPGQSGRSGRRSKHVRGHHSGHEEGDHESGAECDQAHLPCLHR